MNPLVPDFILQQDAQGQHAGTLEATALHVSLPGLMELVEQMISQQEPRTADVHVFFAPLIAAVHQAGGFVAAFTPSGGFTALFPDAPGRQLTKHARRAALSIRRALHEHAARKIAAGGVSSPFRIGLAWGAVSWTIARVSPDRTYFVFHGPAIEACQGVDRRTDDSEIFLDPSFRDRLPAGVRELTADHDEFDTMSGASPTAASSAPAAERGEYLPLGASDVPREGEIREVTILFASFDRLQNPAEMIRTLHESASMYGGTFAGIQATERGLGALFYFGAPVAHESDNDRALDFALELKATGLGTTRLSTGITRARCLIGFVGGAERCEFACMGRAAHLAAQIARKAPPPAIWAEERAFLAGESSHQWSTENIFRFDGFELPILIYSLERRRIAVQEEFYDLGPLGREAELERITQAIEPIFHGRFAGVVHIEGEAGMGKSYLVHSYRHQRAQLRDMRPLLWIEARCAQTLRTPLNAFEFALKEYFGTASVIGQHARQAGLDLALQLLFERLPAGWGDLRERIERSRPAFADLLRLGRGSWPPRSEQERLDGCIAAISTLLLAECSLQPVVVHLDDAHWADSTSLEAIAAIARACKGRPLAILCTSRTKTDGTSVRIPLDPGVPTRSIELNPLPQDRLLALAEPFFGGPIPTMLATMITQSAGGCPFFAQEILAYWLEDGRYTSSTDSRSNRFMPPRNLNSLLVARLERLELRMKQAVVAAAVLGREFDARVLARMVPDPAMLSEHLRYGEAQRIWSRMGEHRFEFSSVLIRDAAYGMQPKAVLQKLHRLAAEAIEALYGDDLEDQRAAIDCHHQLAG